MSDESDRSDKSDERWWRMTRQLGFLEVVEGGDSKFREFEESTFRGFDNLWTCWPVGLWTFQIRCVPLFGWGDL